MLCKPLIFSFFIQKQNEWILNKIKKNTPQHYLVFREFVNEVEKETVWQVVLTSSYRTLEEQQKLRKRDSRNARAGNSKHNLGKAIDLNLYKNDGLWKDWIVKSSSQKHWESSGILRIAEKRNLTWGGKFKNYYDPVHFEIK